MFAHGRSSRKVVCGKFKLAELAPQASACGGGDQFRLILGKFFKNLNTGILIACDSLPDRCVCIPTKLHHEIIRQLVLHGDGETDPWVANNWQCTARKDGSGVSGSPVR